MGIISVTCFFSVLLLNYAYNGRKYPAFISLIHVLRDDQRVLQVIIINVGNNSISNLFKLMILSYWKVSSLKSSGSGYKSWPVVGDGGLAEVHLRTGICPRQNFPNVYTDNVRKIFPKSFARSEWNTSLEYKALRRLLCEEGINHWLWMSRADWHLLHGLKHLQTQAQPWPKWGRRTLVAPAPKILPHLHPVLFSFE